MITIHQRHRETDRQTDTTCDRNTAPCTKVHRAVKTEIEQNCRRSAETKQPTVGSFVLFQFYFSTCDGLNNNIQKQCMCCQHGLRRRYKRSLSPHNECLIDKPTDFICATMSLLSSGADSRKRSTILSPYFTFICMKILDTVVPILNKHSTKTPSGLKWTTEP